MRKIEELTKASRRRTRVWQVGLLFLFLLGLGLQLSGQQAPAQGGPQGIWAAIPSVLKELAGLVTAVFVGLASIWKFIDKKFEKSKEDTDQRLAEHREETTAQLNSFELHFLQQLMAPTNLDHITDKLVCHAKFRDELHTRGFLTNDDLLKEGLLRKEILRLDEVEEKLQEQAGELFLVHLAVDPEEAKKKLEEKLHGLKATRAA